MDPTQIVYDFVPGQDSKIMEEKPVPPPGRRTTTNTTYEHCPGTVHPQATARNHDNGNIEVEPDYEDEGSSSCLRTCVLSILVIFSLCLAILAVVLVLLLWFRVIDTQQECPTVATVTTTVAANTGDSTSNCPCESEEGRPGEEVDKGGAGG